MNEQPNPCPSSCPYQTKQRHYHCCWVKLWSLIKNIRSEILWWMCHIKIFENINRRVALRSFCQRTKPFDDWIITRCTSTRDEDISRHRQFRFLHLQSQCPVWLNHQDQLVARAAKKSLLPQAIHLPPASLWTVCFDGSEDDLQKIGSLKSGMNP